MNKEVKLKNFIALLLLLLGLFYWYANKRMGNGFENQVESNLQEIQNKVANDAVEQYNITLRNGSRIDKCVQAGMVMAAYLQAKDEINYSRWKKIQTHDCKSAGVPQ